jgi:hypothetical protein
MLMHEGSKRFHALLHEIGELHDRKQEDYGSDTDPFANVRASERWGIPAWVGALVRLNDKVARLQAFARKGVLANESAEDSMLDIAVYALIAKVLYEQESRGQKDEMQGATDVMGVVPDPELEAAADTSTPKPMAEEDYEDFLMLRGKYAFDSVYEAQGRPLHNVPDVAGRDVAKMVEEGERELAQGGGTLLDELVPLPEIQHTSDEAFRSQTVMHDPNHSESEGVWHFHESTKPGEWYGAAWTCKPADDISKPHTHREQTP